MENLFVLLKIAGVVGPAVCFAALAYKIITAVGIFSQESCGYFILGSVVVGIAYFFQLSLVSLVVNLSTMPFYTCGLLSGMIISVAIFAWLMWALLQNNFSSGLHLSSLQGLII